MDQLFKKINKAVVEGNLDNAVAGVKKALAEEGQVDIILNEGLIKAMKEVGDLFEAGDFFVPEMLMSARAMRACLEILRPLLVNTGIKPTGKILIGTVAGDLHDIGKNLVTMMMEGAGFDVIDLGVDVKPEQFIENIRKDKPDIVGLSALLTTTMPNMKRTIDAISEAGLRGQVKIIIGGAPVTRDYASEIGADGYAPDAGQAASLARSFVD